MSRQLRGRSENEKEFLSIVDKLCYSRQKWEVWADLITMMACAISNVIDRRPEVYARREEEYRQCLARIGSEELAAKAFAMVVNELDREPDQDFLGYLYMNLELSSHWHGQFFTPYSLCLMSAQMQMPAAVEEVNRKGWISICDPSIGGGAMLIAAANHLRRQGVNYQEHAMFVGQDIDRIAGMMAYIQLSLLGCPGYIAIANTLSNPITGDTLEPVEKEGQEFWYTPFYFSDTWVYRRRMRMLDRIASAGKKGISTDLPKKAPEEKHYTFFFQFEEERNARTEEQPAACRGEIAG